jgi:hypothetical protein
MVFDKKKLANITVSFIFVIRNFFFLIFFPYKGMRKISLEKDYWQIVFIFLLVFIYFKLAYFLRGNLYPATFTFLIFLVNFFLMIGFFYFLGKVFNRKIKKRALFFTFSYSLLPTLIWFFTTLFFYFILPPPRTFSLAGKIFSIFFITFSLTVFFWKLILFYLAIRFSTGLSFFKIIYLIFLFFVWYTPYSVLLYYLKIFRVPFI